VYNCDYLIDEYKKDFVYIQILDINGNIIEDNWIRGSSTNLPVYSSELPDILQGWVPDRIATPPPPPVEYSFSQDVHRGGFRGNAVTSQAETIHIRPNQYFFYMPQIHELDFEHRELYQIELTYGKHIRTIWFAVLDNDKRWDEG